MAVTNGSYHGGRAGDSTIARQRCAIFEVRYRSMSFPQNRAHGNKLSIASVCLSQTSAGRHYGMKASVANRDRGKDGLAQKGTRLRPSSLSLTVRPKRQL